MRRASIDGDMSTSGVKSFKIALDTGASPTYGLLQAPAGGQVAQGSILAWSAPSLPVPQHAP